jgi:hypothetical protein
VSRITIIQVARAMGVELDNSTAWAIGAEMAQQYVDEFAEQPPKELRPKTCGAGSHCFAVYPSTWEERIRNSIAERVEIAAAQKGLFT